MTTSASPVSDEQTTKPGTRKSLAEQSPPVSTAQLAPATAPPRSIATRSRPVLVASQRVGEGYDVTVNSIAIRMDNHVVAIGHYQGIDLIPEVR